MRLPVRGARRAAAPAPGDEGITLIEVIVALMIIAVVMVSAAGFFINGLRSTGGQSARQVAISLTNQQLETVTAIPTAQLLNGRTLSAVNALLATDTGSVLTGRDDTSNSTAMSLDYSTASAPTPTVALSSSKAQNNVAYQIRTFIDPCWLPTGTATSINATRDLACVASSTPPLGAPGISMEYRVTVSASWVGGPGTNCATGCSFNDSTLLDPNKDATFNSNISQPTLIGTTPSSVGASSAQVVTLLGTNFVYGAAVTVTCIGCAATAGVIDQSTNTGASIKVPMTFGATAGTATIRLTNPDGGSATITLTINPAPVVSTYSPGTVRATTPTTVTFTGSNLSSSTTVTASGGTVGPVTYSAGALSFSYVGSAATPSPVFTVTNADGGSTTVSGITVLQSAPTITTVAETTTKSANASCVFFGTSCTYTYQYVITGTGFLTSPTAPTVTLSVGGGGAVSYPPSAVSPTSATISYSSTTKYSGSSYSLTLTNYDGGAATRTGTVQ